ncbi:hypothetical protein BLNAU_18001 [Blattamonas nauphoetae]|uniref:Uncharacterized protein n=1 Tax=Blattamonas nauphoetae TaxID=2049346 RepID=A0ABQ9X5M7_9EUKA|nr:hypothetical protein BLNAU_18001 [Blattamonas nauphoetae]
MHVDKNSITPQIDNAKTEQTNLVEVSLSLLCGESKPLRRMMLKSLLALVTETDWALSTILAIDYIKPLEQYCEQAQPCEVPIALPKLMVLIGKSSEGELDRICESSLPSFLLDWMILIWDDNILTANGDCLLMMTSTPRSSSAFLAHHKTNILAVLDHLKSSMSSFPLLKIIANLCFSPQLDVSKNALNVLSKRCESGSETINFLRTLNVPSGSTESSSELVPFAERLCSTLAANVLEMKSFFTISPLLTGNAVLEMLSEGLSLLNSLLLRSYDLFVDILIKCDFVPLLKSTIIACLDLLETEKNESICPSADRNSRLIQILDRSWNCAGNSLCAGRESLRRAVESAFSDVSQLCSLLERTCNHSSPTHHSHLTMIVNIGYSLPRLIPRLVEENLVERVIDTSKPMAVPTTHGPFHLSLIWAIINLMQDPKDITKNWEERKRIRKLQFERVLKPAKQYLQFILQREEFVPTDDQRGKNLPFLIFQLLTQTLLLEREMLEVGESVEAGREEWEVGWLVEKTNEEDLGERLKEIREDDVKMKTNEKERWKKRVERQREAGHEDAMEGWLMRKDTRPRSEIVEYVGCVGNENGMNVSF